MQRPLSQQTLSAIEQLRQALQSLLPMHPEHQRGLDKKFRLEFGFNSNHLEGNILTYSETELLIIFDQMSGNSDIPHRSRSSRQAIARRFS